MKKPIRVRLWMLLALILIVAVPLGLWANRAREQEQAVRKAVDVGAFVVYAHELDADDQIRRPKPETPGPRWLRRWLGDDYFRTARMVVFPQPRGSDSEVEELTVKRDREVMRLVARLPGLTQLTISGATDESLRYLASHNGLTGLALIGDRYSDAGIESLGVLPNLERFNVQQATGLTDVGCETVARWPKLRSVILYHADVGDAGIEALARCRALSSLVILKNDGWDRITDRAAVALSKTHALTDLCLIGASITDDGVEALASLPDLQHLEMTSGRLTDRALEFFARFPHLKSVKVKSPGITLEGLERLRTARAELRVN